MEEEFDLANIEIALVKTEPEVIRRLFARLSSEANNGCKNPYKEEKQVRKLMRYNVWTIDQFCDISGFRVGKISNLSRPNFDGTKYVSELDICYPFPESTGKGPKFIIRNEKSEKYIKL